MNAKQKNELIHYIHYKKIPILFNIINKIHIKQNSSTCYTNGKIIFIGDLCFENTEQLLVLILHEFLHIIGNSFEIYNSKYKKQYISLEAFNIIEDRIINNFIEKHFPRVLNQIQKCIKKNTNKEIELVNEDNFVEIFNSVNPCCDPEFYNNYINRFENNIIINEIEKMGIKKFLKIINFFYIKSFNYLKSNIQEIEKFINNIENTKNTKIIYEILNVDYNIKVFNNKLQIQYLEDNPLIDFYEEQINYTIFLQILDEKGIYLKHNKRVLLYEILFKNKIENIKVDENLLDKVQKRQIFLNNDKLLKPINIMENINDISQTNKKINKKNKTKIENEIINSVGKFLIKKGKYKSWKREHKTLKNRKGKIHKKQSIQDIQIFIDKSGSMNGIKWTSVKSSINSINKICKKYRLNPLYNFFDTNLYKSMNYNMLKNSNVLPSNGTKINNVLKELNKKKLNIIITDMNDIIDFNLINSKINVLFIHINYFETKFKNKINNKNIKLINIK